MNGLNSNIFLNLLNVSNVVGEKGVRGNLCFFYILLSHVTCKITALAGILKLHRWTAYI